MEFFRKATVAIRNIPLFRIRQTYWELLIQGFLIPLYFIITRLKNYDPFSVLPTKNFIIRRSSWCIETFILVNKRIKQIIVRCHSLVYGVQYITHSPLDEPIIYYWITRSTEFKSSVIHTHVKCVSHFPVPINTPMVLLDIQVHSDYVEWWN